jgi:hypothetical protein
MRESILIRPAGAGDERALLRLAALDSALPLDAPELIAEVCGEIRAAVGADGRAIADPFTRTVGLVAHLRLAR